MCVCALPDLGVCVYVCVCMCEQCPNLTGDNRYTQRSSMPGVQNMRSRLFERVRALKKKSRWVGSVRKQVGSQGVNPEQVGNSAVHALCHS